MKHAKVYMLMGGEPYESDYCFGVYSNKENAEKALKRRENRQFYDPLCQYWNEDISYYIREKEIKDCETIVYGE